MTLITRRTALRGIASVPAIFGGSVAFEAAAESAVAPIAAHVDLDALPIGALWSRAIAMAHDLSDILDRLTPEGDLMVEVHAAKSGHARVGFRDAIPNDARGMLDHYAACYRQTAQAIDPDVTEWSHVTWADDDVDTRFFLAGCRKAVQS